MTNPKHTHAWDQFGAAVREMASALGKYRDELGRQGFSRPEAIALVAHMQQNLLTGMSKDEKPDDGEDWKRG